MLKNILIIIGIIFGLLLLVAIIAKIYLRPSKEVVLNFIKEHPNKASIKLIRNGEVLVERNSTTKMPLASTVKIILAIEYAEQAANQQINPNELVSLAELNNYYIPKTDGGAHKGWLASIKDKIKTDKIPLKEVAIGMMKFSSNANTEWLSEKLGLENINNRLDSLGMKNHTEIYYLVSAMFIGREKFPALEGKELTKKLRELSQEEYIQLSKQIHEKLKVNPDYKEKLGTVGLGAQHVWSDNLPQSTVTDYVELMQKLNSKTYFSEKVTKYLDEVMETLMENKGNQTWLEYAGMKGGSTAFVLTKSLYAKDKKGNKTELAYFLNDLDIFESRRLQGSMNEFELNLLTDHNFLNKVQMELKKQAI